MDVDLLKLHREFVGVLAPNPAANPPPLIAPYSSAPVPHQLSHLTTWFVMYLATQQQAHYNAMARALDHDFYILETGLVVEAYTNELKVPCRMTFGKRREKQPNRLRLVSLFIDIVSRLYLSGDQTRRFDGIIPYNPKATEADKCPLCTATTFSINGDTHLVCTACGYSRETTLFKPNFGDSRRMNLTQKSSYDNNKKNHFISCFNRYQGTLSKPIPQSILEEIRSHLDRYNLVNKAAAHPREKYSRVTKEHISLILRDIKKFKEYHESLAYLFRLVTENRARPVAHLKEKVIHDFDTFNELYNRRYPNSEKEPYNYPHLLFQFLRRHRHNCDPSEFNFLRTTERKIHHDQIYSVLFAELGWNYLPLF